MSDADSSDEPWPPAEFGRKNGGDTSSGPQGLFVDSDDEQDRQTALSSSLPGQSPASTAGPPEVAVKDAESGLLAGTASCNHGGGNGYGSVPTEDSKEELDAGRDEPVAAAGAWCRMPSLPDMLIYGGFLLNMSTKGTIACFETLGAEYAMTHFGMTSAEAGSTFATFGMIGVVGTCGD